MKIAVLGQAETWYARQLQQAGHRRGHAVDVFSFEAMSAKFSGPTHLHQTQPHPASGVTLAGQCTTEFDAIILRTMPAGTLEQVVTRMNLLQMVADSGTTIINSPKAIECSVDKGLTSYRLRTAGVSTPDFAVAESTTLALDHFEQLGRDVVVKPLFGAEGRGILRVTDESMAWRVFRTLERLHSVIYQQAFVASSEGDYRVLVLGGRVLAATRRIPQPGDFRSNAAQNGLTERWTCPADVGQIAMLAAQETGCVFAGIDLIRSADSQWQVLEVNAVPGWKALQSCTQVAVAECFYEWLENTR